jgi:hypothetical protein
MHLLDKLVELGESRSPLRLVPFRYPAAAQVKRTDR